MAKHKKTTIKRRPWFDEHIFINENFEKQIVEFQLVDKLNEAEKGLIKNVLLSLNNEQKRVIELLSFVDDKDLRDELSICFDNVYECSRVIGKFTEPLPFSKIQADGLRTKNARAAKITVIEKRREIIKTHFSGTLAKSSACANRVIKQLEDTFKAEGITQYSSRTITDDIAAIIKN